MKWDKLNNGTGVRYHRPVDGYMMYTNIDFQYHSTAFKSNQYLYTSLNQLAYDIWHLYCAMLMQLVSFHSSVHTGRIPKLI